MKNIQFILKSLFIAAFMVTSFTACDEGGYDEYELELAPTGALNGEWWIDVSDDAGNLYVQHAFHKTYDPGDGSGRMMISDRQGTGFTGWWLEGLVDVNTQNLTFSATDELNLADESHFTITNGKILKNAAHSASGAVTDSIYFEGVFDYDPETTIIFSGHRRTGFEEDEF